MIDKLEAKLEQATLRGDSLERVLDGAQESIVHHQSRIDELELYLSTSQAQYKDAARVIEKMRFVIDNRDDRLKELEAQLDVFDTSFVSDPEHPNRTMSGSKGWTLCSSRRYTDLIVCEEKLQSLEAQLARTNACIEAQRVELERLRDGKAVE